EAENEDEAPVFQEPKQEKREMTTNQDDIDSYFPGDDSASKPQRPAPTVTIHRQQPKVGRNDPCPCGSGKKFKNCCGK
ncbi:MAG: SEC-C domain-containing protein, partial [Victivallales bacterium]|nr:SEC-C domain-containing protein [Victivallales bacterium]